MLRYPIVNDQQLLTAVTATGTGNAFILPNQDFSSLVFALSLSAVSGTTPTLDLYVQVLGPDGNWYDLVHFAQQTAATTANNQIFATVSVGGSTYNGIVGSKTISASSVGAPLIGNTLRLAYTIGGTTPSFTGTVNIYQNQMDRGAN